MELHVIRKEYIVDTETEETVSTDETKEIIENSGDATETGDTEAAEDSGDTVGETDETTETEEETKPQLPYTIEFENGVLTLGVVSVNFNNKEFSGEIEIDCANNTHSVFDVRIRENMDDVGLSAYKIFNYIDQHSNLYNKKIDGQKVARVLVDSEDVWLYLSFNSDEIEGFDNVIDDGSKSTTGLLQEKSEWFKEQIALFKKKSKMLNGVDNFKSLAYLEAQVDLLTRIALGNTDSGLLAALQVADDYSVLNMKPLEDVEAEFTTGKKALREMQEAYYGNLKE